MIEQSDFINELEDRVRSFLLTAYLTNSDEFNKDRARLISDRMLGPMFRDSRFEILSRYVRESADAKSILALIRAKEILASKNFSKYTDFLEVIAPVRDKKLFSHQLQSIEAVHNDKKHLVVTTGTGSGKSFCFLIPMLLNLLKEASGRENSNKWIGGGLRQKYNWWTVPTGQFHTKRISAMGRTPAVRAMIMYPLNALVQDQVESLTYPQHLVHIQSDNLYCNHNRLRSRWPVT